MSYSTGMETTQYYVLLALAKAPAHGYTITEQITADSVGAIYLRPSTMYFVLSSLEKAKLIEAVGNRPAAGAVGNQPAGSTPAGAISGRTRRKTYRITQEGRRRLAITAGRYTEAARLAQERLGWRN